MVTTEKTLHEKLLQVMDQSKLWEGSQRSTHGFLLSPDVYHVSDEHQNQLEKLCPALNECLSGFGRLVAIAQTPEFVRTNAYRLINTVANVGAPLYYRDAQFRRPSCLPVVCKCDLMDATDGTLKIAEIDGINKHGFGYGALVNRLRDAIGDHDPESCYPGIAHTIAQAINQPKVKYRACPSPDGRYNRRNLPPMVSYTELEWCELGLLFGEHERFYLPEFRVFADEMKRYKVKVTMVGERDLKLKEGEVTNLPSRILVDLPACVRNPQLSETLAGMYVKGEVDFLLPPKPFLSSKGVMALLRNDEHDEDLECTLRSQISSSALATVRAHLPPTYLVTRRNLGFIRDVLTGSGTPYVLKAVISNGMKGTIFMEDSRYETVLAELSKIGDGSYILQEEVVNKPETFNYFQPDGELRDDTWYKRMIVHFARGLVADIDITARRDKKVHGAKDCLQLGVIRGYRRTGGVY